MVSVLGELESLLAALNLITLTEHDLIKLSGIFALASVTVASVTVEKIASEWSMVLLMKYRRHHCRLCCPHVWWLGRGSVAEYHGLFPSGSHTLHSAQSYTANYISHLYPNCSATHRAPLPRSHNQTHLRTICAFVCDFITLAYTGLYKLHTVGGWTRNRDILT